MHLAGFITRIKHHFIEFCGKLEVQLQAFEISVAGTAQIVPLHVTQEYTTVEV